MGFLEVYILVIFIYGLCSVCKLEWIFKDIFSRIMIFYMVFNLRKDLILIENLNFILYWILLILERNVFGEIVVEFKV